ncbi:hypothetical protein [Lonepinella sp. MS14436]|uniref:hypothetical protein n=1 Tax=Lonepinella sp. MS14436 TaxID=3003619 RepID=UPI0036D96726
MKDNFRACQWAYDNASPDDYDDRNHVMDDDFDDNEPPYDGNDDCDYWKSNCYGRG